jgi:RNA polymerase sigma factor (TIGR02999 family)
MSEVTVLIEAIQAGDPHAAEHLLPLIYDDLRRLAASRLTREGPGQTLQPTELVHEAYLRLVGCDAGSDWGGRDHFFAAAAEAMRRILVDSARRKRTLKRGGDATRSPLDEAELLVPEPREDVLALDEALTELEATDHKAAELVKLRYFGDLSIAEAAHVLGISPRTAARLWTYARAWLRRKLGGATSRR